MCKAFPARSVFCDFHSFVELCGGQQGKLGMTLHLLLQIRKLRLRNSGKVFRAQTCRVGTLGSDSSNGRESSCIPALCNSPSSAAPAAERLQMGTREASSEPLSPSPVPVRLFSGQDVSLPIENTRERITMKYLPSYLAPRPSSQKCPHTWSRLTLPPGAPPSLCLAHRARGPPSVGASGTPEFSRVQKKWSLFLVKVNAVPRDSKSFPLHFLVAGHVTHSFS